MRNSPPWAPPSREEDPPAPDRPTRGLGRSPSRSRRRRSGNCRGRAEVRQRSKTPSLKRVEILDGCLFGKLPFEWQFQSTRQRRDARGGLIRIVGGDSRDRYSTRSLSVPAVGTPSIFGSTMPIPRGKGLQSLDQTLTQRRTVQVEVRRSIRGRRRLRTRSDGQPWQGQFEWQHDNATRLPGRESAGAATSMVARAAGGRHAARARRHLAGRDRTGREQGSEMSPARRPANARPADPADRPTPVRNESIAKIVTRMRHPHGSS